MYAIIITCLVLIIVASIVFYKIGEHKKVVIEFEKSNAAFEQEKEKLKKDIDILNQSIQVKNQNLNLARQRIEEINLEYQDKRQMINDASDLARKEHEEKSAAYQQQYESSILLLDKEYKEKNDILDNEYITKKESYDAEIETLISQLKSLQNQKAATIEALEREQAVREQANLYRLDISEQDKQDVKFLQSIQYRISKPRVVAMLIWQTYYQPIAKKKFPLILGTEKVCGIYKITNMDNQKVYIGQAVDMRERWLQHCKKGLGIDTPQNNKLYAAMLQDGLENFTFELLESCEPSELNEKEKYYINLYNACEYGYNLTSGNN